MLFANTLLMFYGDAMGNYVCYSCKKETNYTKTWVKTIVQDKLFHILTSISTGGLWIPIWVIFFTERVYSYTCYECGGAMLDKRDYQEH